MTNRRKFLKNASLMTAAGVWAANSDLAAASVSALSGVNANKNFGLQTWSLGGELAPDVPGGLRRLSQMGYKTLELAGYNTEGRIGQVPIADFKKMADDAGLKIVSSHVGHPARGMHTRENLQIHLDHWKIAADHHASIGCKYIIQPGQPASTRSVEEVALTGEHYNEIGKVVKAAGLIFGFHNHSNEFARVVPGGTEPLPVRLGGGGRAPEGSKIIMDGLLEAFDPSLVVFELDVYWCVMGMQDPVAWMRRYPNHTKLLHIKDVAVLGESGMMNFKKIFETAYSNGIEEFIVELEGYRGGSQFDGVRACADYLLKADFVR